MNLEGKVAIVTGAGRGIGRAEALRLAADGAAVIVNDYDAVPAAEVAAQIRAAGGRAAAFAGDVSGWETGQAMIAQAIKSFGRLDVLVNNAGIARPRMIFNMSEDEWDSVTRVHLKGTFVPTRFAAAYWREQTKLAGMPCDASVIMTTSGNGLHGVPGHINYVAAKAGIAGMTTTLAKELEPYGVRVNAIAPLAFTRMTESLHGGAVFPESRRDELDPDQVAQIVGWLASRRAEGITGQIVSCSGRRLNAYAQWPMISSAESAGPWTYDALDRVRTQLFGQ